MSERITLYDDPGNGRALSQLLWGDCPRESIMANPSQGLYVHDDFMYLPTGKYTATAATSGTFAIGAAEGGVAVADPGAATANQGINVQLTGAQFKPAVGKRIYFEARVKASAITSGINFFLGLAEVDTTIIAASAVSTANHIGFSSVTTDGVLLFNSEKASAGDTGACTTLVADTWLKLGFLVDELNSIKQYVDGVLTGTAKVAANIPIVELVPSLVCIAKGTQNTVSIDYLSVFQKGISA